MIPANNSLALKLHELTGLKNGLEFLARRLSKSSPASHQLRLDYAKGISRYVDILQRSANDSRSNLSQDGNFIILSLNEIVNQLSGSEVISPKQSEAMSQLLSDIISRIEREISKLSEDR